MDTALAKIRYCGEPDATRKGYAVTENTKTGFGNVPGCIIVAGLVALFCGCFGLSLVPGLLFGEKSLSEKDIREGRPCTATVLSVKETSDRRNRERVFAFRLRVKPDEGTTDDGYEVTVRDAPNAIEAGRVKTDGTKFRCVIHRDDESRVKVFWADEMN